MINTVNNHNNIDSNQNSTRLDNRVLCNSQPKNFWQDFNITTAEEITINRFLWISSALVILKSCQEFFGCDAIWDWVHSAQNVRLPSVCPSGRPLRWVSKHWCHCPCAPWNVDLEATDPQVGWTNMAYSIIEIIIGTTQQCHFEWRLTLNDLAKYSITGSVARSLCDSWASCYDTSCHVISEPQTLPILYYYYCTDSLISAIIIMSSIVLPPLRNPHVSLVCPGHCV